MWNDSKEDFTEDTFEEFEGYLHRQYQEKKYNTNNANKKFASQQNHYQYYHYKRADPQTDLTKSHSESSATSPFYSRPVQKNYSKSSSCTLSRSPHSPQLKRNHFPLVHAKKSQEQENPSWLSENDEETSRNSNEKDFKKTQKVIPATQSSTKDEAKKLLILRHSPLPAAAKVSPKKIIEKITKLNKELLKQIINNPSKYDDVLQNFRNEQIVEVNDKLEKPILEDEEKDKGSFEIVPDGIVELPSNFFDFFDCKTEETQKQETKMENDKEIEIGTRTDTKTDENIPVQNSEIFNSVQNNEQNFNFNLMNRLIAAENIKTSHARRQGRDPKIIVSRIQKEKQKESENNEQINKEPKEIDSGVDEKINGTNLYSSQEKESNINVDCKASNDSIISVKCQGTKKEKMCKNIPSVKNVADTPISPKTETVEQQNVTIDLTMNEDLPSKKTELRRVSRGEKSIRHTLRSEAVKKSLKLSTMNSNSRSSSTSSSSSSTSSGSTSASSSSSTSDSAKSSSSCSISSLSRSGKCGVGKKRSPLLSEELHIQYIVDMFQSRILPNLSNNIKRRYQENCSNSLDKKLLFICRICTNNRYNTEKFSRSEILKIQRGLKSTDKKHAIIILLREVRNVIKKQPEVADTAKRKPTTKRDLKNRIKENSIDLSGNVVQSSESDGNIIDEKPIISENSEMLNEAHTNETTVNNDDFKLPELDPALQKDSSPPTASLLENNFSTNPFINSFHPFLSLPVPDSGTCLPTIHAEKNILPTTISEWLSQQSFPSTLIPNIHAIDCKILDLRKHKEFIKEMVAKLLNENLQLDLQISNLQRDRLELINAAITANTSTNALTSIAKENLVTTQNLMKPKKPAKRTLDTPTVQDIVRAHKLKNIKRSPNTGEDNKNQSDKENEVMIKNGIINDIDFKEINNPCSFDYSNIPTGELNGIESPVTQICVYENYIFCGTEIGQLYRFDATTLQKAEQSKKHNQAITQLIFCKNRQLILSASLDGFLKFTPMNDLQSDKMTVNANEELQSFDFQWDIAFLGTRAGNLLSCDSTKDTLSVNTLCTGDSSIMAVKATKEGPRKIVIISTKGNLMSVRDALTGLLLRIINVSDDFCIYGFLFDESHLYCGTQRQQIIKFDFTTGARISTFYSGNGVVAIKLYRNKFLVVACYDGYIYFLNKNTGDKIEMIQASGRLPLSLEIIGNKVLTSSKDKIVKIIDIPLSVVTG